MKTILAAMAVAMAVSTGAMAQTMDEPLSMLEVAAQKEFDKIGITGVDPMDLTLNQLSLIKSVMGSSDYNDNEKSKQIMAIVENN
jgi:hypothetical protein